MFVELTKELEESFPVYLVRRQEDIMNIEASLERRDFQVVKVIGTKIQSNATNFGMSALANIGQTLATVAGDRKLDECQKLAQEMKTYIKEVKPKFI